MKRRAICIVAVLVAFALVSNLAWAQGRGKQGAQQDKTAGEKVREVLPESTPVFTTREETLVKKWFTENLDGLPPGLAKREQLPAGLERQLREKGKLPPGLEKKIQPLPAELERQLTKLPTGYRRVVIAGNVILMNETTGLIYEIIRNVIP